MSDGPGDAPDQYEPPEVDSPEDVVEVFRDLAEANREKVENDANANPSFGKGVAAGYDDAANFIEAELLDGDT